MKDDDLKIRVRAYEKDHPKTHLSDFVNDMGFVDGDTLDDLLKQMKDWIVEHFAGYSGGIPSGNINGGDIADRPISSIDRNIDGKNVVLRPITKIRLYAYGGKVEHRTAVIDGLD